MIAKTFTVKAARKACQAASLYSIAALKTKVGIERWGTRVDDQLDKRYGKFMGTKRLNRVSNGVTANRGAWEWQGLSATSVPSPGGDK